MKRLNESFTDEARADNSSPFLPGQAQTGQGVWWLAMDWQPPLRLLLAVLVLGTLAKLQAQTRTGQDPAVKSSPHANPHIGNVLLSSPEPSPRAYRSVVIDTQALQQAEDLFASNQAPRALALLAAVLRKDPSNHLAADRLVAALTYRHFPRLLEVSNAPAQPALPGSPPWRSPDGQRELRRLGEGTGRLYDLRTGEPLGAPLKHAKWISAASFSPDGLRIATVSNSDRSARIWDATTGEPLSPLLKHRSYINSAQFSPDGVQLVTGSCDQTVRVWDGFSGAPRSEPMKVGSGIVSYAEFSPDSQTVLAYSSEGGTAGSFQQLCYVFDALPGACLSECVTDPVNPQMTSFTIGETNQTTRVWDIGTGPPSAHAAPVGASARASFSADGQRLVFRALTNLDDHIVLVLDGITRQPLSEPLRHDSPVKSAWFDPRNPRVIVALADGTNRAWDLPQCPAPVPEWLSDLAEAVAGMKLNHEMRPENVPWADRVKIQQQLAGAVLADYPQFSADGRRMVTASSDKTARVWDAGTGRPLIVSHRHEGGVDPCGAWAKWFLADRSTRMISPFSSFTITEYVRTRVQENTFKSLREAVRLVPTNGLAFARLAKQVLAQSEKDNPRRIGEADFFSRYALKWSPNDPEVQHIRNEIVRRIGKSPNP